MPLNMEYYRLFTAKHIAKIDLQREFTDVFQFAITIENPQTQTAVRQYLSAISYQEETLKADSRKDDIPLTDHLKTLNKSITQLIHCTHNFFGSIPTASSRTVLGCEPPPGSIIDTNNNTIVPVISHGI